MARSSDLDLSDDLSSSPNRRSESGGGRRATHASPLSREGLASVVRTAVWLIPLTVLIWVYAEQQQQTSLSVSVPIRSLQSSVSDRYVTFTDPAQQPSVNLTLTGPREGIDAVRNRLDGEHGIPLDVGRRVGTGLPVNVLYAVQNLPEFRSAGVTVSAAQPPEITVNVDPLVGEEAEVEVRDGSNLNLAAPPTFYPPRVMLHGPKSQLDAIRQAENPADGRLRVYADFSKFLPGLQPGDERPLTGVPLFPPVAEDQVAIQPPQVTATVRVKAADVSYTIRSVYILITMPPNLLHGFDVRLGDGDVEDPSISNVHVAGPPQQIELLKEHNGQPAQFNPTANLLVRDTDVGHDARGTLTYNLPPGVKVTPDDANRTVPFKMIPRSSAPGG